MPRRLGLITPSLVAVLAGGCEAHDRPRRPLPEGFAMQVLDADGSELLTRPR